MVGVCLHDMAKEHHVFLENLSFSSFYKLMQKTRRKNQSIEKTPKPSLINCPNPMVRQFPRKRPMWPQSKELRGKAFIIKKPSNKQEYRVRGRTRSYTVPLLYQISHTLFEQWVKDLVLFLRYMQDQKDVMYCLFHHKKGHIWGSLCFLERFLIKSVRLVRFCSTMKELLASMSVLLQTITTTKARDG